MGKDQELLSASRKGDLDMVHKLLTNKSKIAVSLGIKVSAHVNCQDLSGYTPLHHASLNGHCEIVELLLDNSASARVCDDKGCFPLHLAAWSGYSVIAQILLTHGPSVASVNEKNGDNETALHCASQHGHTTTVKVLLQNGADPSIRNIRDESALDLACQYGRLKVVQMLLQNSPTLLQRSPDCFSPLHLASRNGHKEVVELLLAHAADINGAGENGTALHEAALFGKLEVVKLLLDRGANPHSLDPQNRTALELVKQMDTDMTRNISQLILARLQDGDDYECVHSITPNISTPQIQRVNNLDSPHTYMDMSRAFLEKSISMHKYAVTVNIHSKWNSNDGKENENTNNKHSLSNTSSPLTSLRRSRKGGFSLRRSSSARSTKSLPRLPSTRSLSCALDLSSSEQIRQRHPSTNMFPATPFSLPTTPLLSFSKQDPGKSEDQVFHPTPRKRRLSLRSPHTQSMITSTTTAIALESMLKQNKPQMERTPWNYKDKTKPKENFPLKATERLSVRSGEKPQPKKQTIPLKPKTPLQPVINTPLQSTKPSEPDENSPKVEILPLKLPVSGSPGGSVKPKKPLRSKFSVSSVLTPSPPPVPPKPHKRSFNSQVQESNENAVSTNSTLSPNDFVAHETSETEEAVYANFESYSTDVPPSPCTAMTLVSNTLQKAISRENLFDDSPVFETLTSSPSVIVSNEENIVLYDNINLPYADDSITENQEDNLNTRTASPSGQKSDTPVSNPTEQSQSTESPRILSSTFNQSTASQEISISQQNLHTFAVLPTENLGAEEIETFAVLPTKNLGSDENTTNDIEKTEITIETVDMQTDIYYENVTKNTQDNLENHDDAVFLFNDKNVGEKSVESEIIRSPISFVEVKSARILSTKSTDSNLSASQFQPGNVSTNSLTPPQSEDTTSVKDKLLPSSIELNRNTDDWNDQLSDRTEDFEIPTEVRKFRGLIRGTSYKEKSARNYNQEVSPNSYAPPSMLKSTHIETKRGIRSGNSPQSSVSLDGDEHKNSEAHVIERCDTNNNNSLSSGKESPFSSSDENTLPDYNTIYNTVSEVRSQSQPNSEAGDEWKQIANIMASISVDESSKGSIYAKEFEETFWKIMTGSELPLQVSMWLSELGLPQYETVLVGNGFDNVDFLANDVLEEQDLLDMGIPDLSHRRKLIESAKNLSQLKPLSQMDTSNLPLTLTEWLMMLELPVEYGDLFNISDVDYITKLYNLQENEIKAIIPKRGHFKRIMASLRPTTDQFNSNYQLKSPWKSTENIKQAKKVENSRSRINSAPGRHLSPVFPPKPTKLEENFPIPTYMEVEKMNEMTNPTNNNMKSNITLRPPNETNNEVTVSAWRHTSDTLINGSCTYQAYYLGSMLIQELKGIESTREACTKMKKSTGAMKKIPTITLAINYKGVKFIDFKSKHEIVEHEIRNISFTSQDIHDLSTFAYITHDTRTGHHYCHVFRVTTLDMAYEIILTLGQAFEVAYQMILNEKPQS